ncbi:MAG: triose-phosphate isomerase [Deltaproteobacteria bacterium]|nr:triose-phosphate isomerase [Deltaproteobacteria bacterium]
MRRPLIVGNWKLHKTLGETLELVNAIKTGSENSTEVDIAVAPVFTALSVARATLAESRVGLAAQNCYPEKQGAFTGEVSPALLKDIGCLFVILGHSERRQLFGEDGAFINRKVHAVIKEGLVAILCIGETLAQREAGTTFDILATQLREGLQKISAEDMKQVVIAYEPVWAIGTGKTATPEQAEEVHAFIRSLLASTFDAGVAQSTRILYGGSVKPDNVDNLMAQPDLDGALVGGASLKSADFLRIINFQKS